MINERAAKAALFLYFTEKNQNRIDILNELI